MKKRLKQKARQLLQSIVSNTFKVPAMAGAKNVDPYRTRRNLGYSTGRGNAENLQSG